jgi:hypothetical protein
VLRQALGFTISVVVAAGDFALLEDMASSGDPDLRWVVRENLKKGCLQRWPTDSHLARSPQPTLARSPTKASTRRHASADASACSSCRTSKKPCGAPG